MAGVGLADPPHPSGHGGSSVQCRLAKRCTSGWSAGWLLQHAGTLDDPRLHSSLLTTRLVLRLAGLLPVGDEFVRPVGVCLLPAGGHVRRRKARRQGQQAQQQRCGQSHARHGCKEWGSAGGGAVHAEEGGVERGRGRRRRQRAGGTASHAAPATPHNKRLLQVGKCRKGFTKSTVEPAKAVHMPQADHFISGWTGSWRRQ